MAAPVVDPLTWNIPIVDANGNPTPEFQRKWGQQAAVNKFLGGGGGGGGGAAAPLHDRLTFSAPGLFSSWQQFTLPPAPQSLRLPAVGASVSSFLAGFPPNGNPTFYLVQDLAAFFASPPNPLVPLVAAGAVAMLTCAAGSGVGSVKWLGRYTIPFGQLLTLVMPLCADLALGNIVCQFVGDPT